MKCRQFLRYRLRDATLLHGEETEQQVSGRRREGHAATGGRRRWVVGAGGRPHVLSAARQSDRSLHGALAQLHLFNKPTHK